MGSRAFLVAAVVVVVAAAGVGGDFAADRAECSDKLVALATCLTYVQGQAPAPTPDCCAGLKTVLQSSRKCLCVLVKDSDEPGLGFKINVTKALGLPAVCSAPANISDCPRLLNLPPNSKDAQIFEEYAKQQAAQGSPSGTGMASSGCDDMPKEKVRDSVPEGFEVPICWCQDRCRLMKSEDMSYTFGRRFFMCANYETEPAKLGVYDRRPRSPPPLCNYIQWVDSTQSEADEKQLRREMLWRQGMFERRMHEAEEEEKRKRREELRRNEKKEAERHATEAREAERTRKRELARHAKGEGEEAHASRMRKEKYPKFP